MHIIHYPETTVLTDVKDDDVVHETRMVIYPESIVVVVDVTDDLGQVSRKRVDLVELVKAAGY